MLTDIKVRNAKPKDRPYKMYDRHGLFLLVNPCGSKLWRFRYQFNNKANSLSLGPYPQVRLTNARKQRDSMLLDLRNGVSPSIERKRRKVAAKAAAHADRSTFYFVALQYLLKQAGIPPSGRFNALDQLRREFEKKLEQLRLEPESRARAGTLHTMHRRLERFIFPYLGKAKMDEITGPSVLAVIRKIEERGTIETAHRTLAVCRRICRFAVSEGKANFDAAGSIDVRESLVPIKRRHFPAITEPRKIGELLRAIYGYDGQLATEAALKMLPHVFVRPGELRAAEWAEIDLERAEWRIPAARMKMRREHIVPLSVQVVEVFRDLLPITGGDGFVFPGQRGRNRYISENTMNSALRRLGYTKDEMCPHGFRAMASTRLNEMGYDSDVIELQLAHKPSDSIRAAYNRSERLDDRRKMMQEWSDHLDILRLGRAPVELVKSA